MLQIREAGEEDRRWVLLVNCEYVLAQEGIFYE